MRRREVFQVKHEKLAFFIDIIKRHLDYFYTDISFRKSECRSFWQKGLHQAITLMCLSRNENSNNTYKVKNLRYRFFISRVSEFLSLRNHNDGMYLTHRIQIRTVRSQVPFSFGIFDSFWLVWAEIQCTVHVLLCPNGQQISLNQQTTGTEGLLS